MSVTCPNGHASAADDYCDTCGAPIPAGAAAAGAPAGPAGPPPARAQAGATECPHCGTDNLADALFCENCGYDFTTGAMPRPLAPPPGIAPTSSLDIPLTPPTPTPPTPPAKPPTQLVQQPPHTEQPPQTEQPAQAEQAAQTEQPQQATATQPIATVEWVAEVWVDPDWYAAQEADEPCPSPGLPLVVPLRERSLLVGRTSASRNIHPEVDLSSDVGVSRRHAQLTSDGQRWWVEDLQSANGTYIAASNASLPEEPIPVGRKRELAEDDRIYLGAWTRVVVRRATPEEQAGQT